MKIGIPTLIELPNLIDNAELCAELNCDFLEINLSIPFKIDDEVVSKLLKIKEEAGIYYTLHFPENADIAHNNKIFREAYLKYFDYVMDLSKKLDVKLINIHLEPGVHINLPDKKVRIYEENIESYIENADTSLKYMLKKCIDNGIFLSIENTKMLPYMLDTVIRFNDYGGHITIDVGHDYTSKDNFKEFIDCNNLNLIHMHLHDANDNKNHLELFCGNLDIKELLDFSKKKEISVLIEVKTIQSLTNSIEKLRKMNLI